MDSQGEDTTEKCETLSKVEKEKAIETLRNPIFTPFVEKKEPKASFESLWGDARALEEEIEVLKWMARRKEIEWDCTRQMIGKKKSDIKDVKRKINMVRTVNDLGEQLNVDSDDEDTPYEESDESSSDEDDNGANRSREEINAPLFVRQPSPKPSAGKRRRKGEIDADFVAFQSRFAKGHKCLYCKEKSPLFVCSLCKNVWYCSTSCQLKDWANHKTKCRPESENERRKISKPPPNLIRFPVPHNIFYSRNALDSQPNQNFNKTHSCLMCKKNLPYFLCADCQNHWYCSHKCHEDHWPIHRLYCQ